MVEVLMLLFATELLANAIDLSVKAHPFTDFQV